MRKATKPRRGGASLDEVLAYENPRVIRGFLRDYDLEPAEVRLLFREMLKLVWLHDRLGGKYAIWWSWKPLDDMWHWFVLHTRDYEDFCLRYFGRMVHHDPETRGDQLAPHADDGECVWQSYERGVHEAIEVTWRELGAETANRWFHEFWERYTPEFLDRHQRRASATFEEINQAILAESLQSPRKTVSDRALGPPPVATSAA